jgi:plastocyanin
VLVKHVGAPFDELPEAHAYWIDSPHEVELLTRDGTRVFPVTGKVLVWQRGPSPSGSRQTSHSEPRSTSPVWLGTEGTSRRRRCSHRANGNQVRNGRADGNGRSPHAIDTEALIVLVFGVRRCWAPHQRALAAGCHEGMTRGTGAAIKIVDACFTPTILHVQPGQTVTWVNADPFVHNITANGWGHYDDLKPSERFTAAFATPVSIRSRVRTIRACRV